MPQIKFIQKVICLPVSEMFLSYKNNTQNNGTQCADKIYRTNIT